MLATKQLFKEYSHKYRKLIGTILEHESFDKVEAEKVTRWQGSMRGMNQFSHEEIAEAVYLCGTAEKWQKFRVSLKGWSTPAKLYRLYKYFCRAADEWHNDEISFAEFKREELRVLNYLGALIRGGQIDKEGNVLK